MPIADYRLPAHFHFDSRLPLRQAADRFHHAIEMLMAFRYAAMPADILRAKRYAAHVAANTQSGAMSAQITYCPASPDAHAARQQRPSPLPPRSPL